LLLLRLADCAPCRFTGVKWLFTCKFGGILRSAFPFFYFRFFSLLLLFAFSGASFSQTTKAQLEVSETIFSLTAALNSCGYDSGLGDSLPLRQLVRADVQKAIANSPEAGKALKVLCEFRREHTPSDAGRDTSQYISLALDLGPPPLFKPTIAEADLPPDAAQVLGFASLLQGFYKAAGLHAVWQKHQIEYESLVRQFHDPVANLITETDLYLKLPFSNTAGSRFVVYLEPLLAPGQVNARNYAENYFLVVSPAKEGVPERLRLPEIRHTYLHFILDPLALRHAKSLKRIELLLNSVQDAPLDTAYKYDVGLLVNECLIRAIEARTIPGGRSNEKAQRDYVQHSVEEGFILTHYFYEALAVFEKNPTGLKDAYGDFLYNVSLEHEQKRARDVQFAAQAAPEVVHASKRSTPHEQRLLDTAEDRLSSGDPASAQKLALQVINDPKTNEDSGRALFILARAATLSGDMQGAESYFGKAIQNAHDPRTLAWSHIYLGRILDIQENRDGALEHYRAALTAGDPTPDTKVAAEKGLAAPYEPRKPR
jgi:tetratricopeptide (TPR) repeat protein